MIEIGTTLDRFRVLRRLGTGGMATVYLVKDGATGELRALKLLHVPIASVQARLRKEGQVQAHLRHPNIVSVSEVVEIQGAPALLMELVPGPSLDRVIETTRLSPAQIDALARGVLSGVAEAHRRGVIHRDLKPSNILLDLSAPAPMPKVSDFGLVKVLTPDPELLPSAGPVSFGTRTGATMGTIGYIAPEQIGDTRNADARADVFSLGCILYELVAGARAFPFRDLVLYMQAVHGQSYPALPETEPRWSALIARCLRYNPDDRPASAVELLRDWGRLDAEASWESLEPLRADPPDGATWTGLHSLGSISAGSTPPNTLPFSTDTGPNTAPPPTLAPAPTPAPRAPALVRVAAIAGWTLGIAACIWALRVILASNHRDLLPTVRPPSDAQQRPAAPDDAALAALRFFAPGVQDPRTVALTAERLAALRDSEQLRSGFTASRAAFAEVQSQIRAAGLPELLVGLPYAESRMNSAEISGFCAAGAWQFMPETAVKNGLQVADCVITNRTEPWTPTAEGDRPAREVYSPYGACLIQSCRIDERLNLQRSTEAALRDLSAIAQNPKVNGHPQRAALLALGHHLGPRNLDRWLDGPWGEDPIGAMHDCKANACVGIAEESKVYVPSVVANAAFAFCLAAEQPPAELCGALGL